MTLKIYFIAATAFVLLQSCTGSQPKANEGTLPTEVIDTTARPNPYANSKVEVSVFNNDTTTDKNLGGYGYNILIDGKPYVHQPHIPAVAGNKGFATLDAANKAGAFVAYKIKNNIMPPSITEHELDSVGALR
jgi:Domain of unknown function (DUF4907)